jgi:hypothetical protein
MLASVFFLHYLHGISKPNAHSSEHFKGEKYKKMELVFPLGKALGFWLHPEGLHYNGKSIILFPFEGQCKEYLTTSFFICQSAQ